MQFFTDIRVRMIHSRPISDTMNRVPTIFSYWNSRTFPGLWCYTSRTNCRR